MYNFDRDGDVISEDKYYRKHAEGFAAAARLAEQTNDDTYRDWYDRIWTYAWENLVNEKYGNWSFELTRNNEVRENVDSTPSVRTGYHPLGACFDVMRAVE